MSYMSAFETQTDCLVGTDVYLRLPRLVSSPCPVPHFCSNLHKLRALTWRGSRCKVGANRPRQTVVLERCQSKDLRLCKNVPCRIYVFAKNKFVHPLFHIVSRAC